MPFIQRHLNLWVISITISIETRLEFASIEFLVYIPHCETYIPQWGTYIPHWGTYVPQCGM